MLQFPSLSWGDGSGPLTEERWQPGPLRCVATVPPSGRCTSGAAACSAGPVPLAGPSAAPAARRAQGREGAGRPAGPLSPWPSPLFIFSDPRRDWEGLQLASSCLPFLLVKKKKKCLKQGREGVSGCVWGSLLPPLTLRSSAQPLRDAGSPGTSLWGWFEGLNQIMYTEALNKWISCSPSKFARRGSRAFPQCCQAPRLLLGSYGKTRARFVKALHSQSSLPLPSPPASVALSH